MSKSSWNVALVTHTAYGPDSIASLVRGYVDDVSITPQELETEKGSAVDTALVSFTTKLSDSEVLALFGDLIREGVIVSMIGHIVANKTGHSGGYAFAGIVDERMKAASTLLEGGKDAFAWASGNAH